MGDRFLVADAWRERLAAVGIVDASSLLARATPADATSVQMRIAPWGAEGPTSFLKAYRAPTAARRRRMLGHGTGWGAAPCLAEFENLAWLRAHGVPAVEPLAAAACRRRGALHAHALLVRWEEDVVDLSRGLPDDEAIVRLAEVVARMHALGFHHRDLHPRNVLLGVGPRRGEVLLLDCRRGGVGGLRRRRAFDLRCLLASGVVPRDLFLPAYVRARAAFRAVPPGG